MDSSPPPLAGTAGPRRTVLVDGVTVTLLGTAHVSQQSAIEVAAEIDGGGYDVVAIELDPGRHAALIDRDSFARLDLYQAWRAGRLGMVAVSLALGAFQQRLADQLGIEPGAEMRAAIERSGVHRLPLWLIDRDLGVTLRRVIAGVPWWQRPTLLLGLVGSVLDRRPVDPAEIERLKEGDVLSATFTEFAQGERRIYGPLIDERDHYMAGRIRQEIARARRAGRAAQRVLVVIGAGHLSGLATALEATDPGEAAIAESLLALNRVPQRGAWGRILPWGIAALVIAGFAVGFSREPDLGFRLLLDWTLINGGLAGLGAAIALAHPLTVVASALAAPLTSLNPLIGVGFVAAGIELSLRRPRVGDLEALRRDVTKPRGWWSNRAARSLLVFAFTTLGSAIGTWVAGFRIAERLW
jgi:pheromone shutdown-related protein TraB